MILACGIEKLPREAPAVQLYRGRYFRASLGLAKLLLPSTSDLYIISAKYGLIRATTHIKPYNAKMGTDTQVVTQIQVDGQVEHLGLVGESVLLAGGMAYQDILTAAGMRVVSLADLMKRDGISDTRMCYQIQWMIKHREAVKDKYETFTTH